MGSEPSTSEQTESQSTWLGLLRDIGSRLVPIFVSSAGLIGFVAFAGGISVWTRFSAAQVPPDQALAVLPRGELVAIGSVLLLLFGFFGALALIGVFLIDRSGRATPGMSRALLTVLMVEGLVAIALADGVSLIESVVVALLFLFPLCVIFWSTFLGGLVGLSDEHPAREGELAKPRSHRGLLRPGEPGDVPRWAAHSIQATAVIPLLAAAAAVAMLVFDAGDVLILSVVGVFLAAFVSLCLFLWYRDSRLVGEERRAEKEREEAALEEEEGELLTRFRLLLPGEQEKREAQLSKARELMRLAKIRPHRLTFHPLGIAVMLLAIALAVVLPAWKLGEWWLAGSLAAAAVLAVCGWRVAILSADKILWFGLAVFISVPLFGTVSAMFRNLDDPQVQPMALIRKTDGPGEAIQGLYVTEADERVYFATVATEGCGQRIVPDSGRLLWIPKSELVAMAVGPLQSVDQAAITSLEMSQSLASKVGASTPVSGAPAPLRLERTGSAIRPRFGAGERLVPEEARPGSVVSLRLSVAEKHDGERGFGKTRNGRTLRVGGLPAPILREKVLNADEAEYVKTVDEQVLTLDGQGVYVRDRDDDLVSFRVPLNGSHRFVRLAASGEVQADEVGETPAGTLFEVDQKAGEPKLLKGQLAVVGSHELRKLQPRLLRQSWHEEEIRFRVPRNASSGVVSLECGQLATEPLLHVAARSQRRLAHLR